MLVPVPPRRPALRPRHLLTPRRVRPAEPVDRVLEGEWQPADAARAQADTAEEPLSGQLSVDEDAVSRYREAAGDLPEITTGQLIDTHA